VNFWKYQLNNPMDWKMPDNIEIEILGGLIERQQTAFESGAEY